ncbi:MAG: hypothetical protein ABR986_05040 [Methanomassiliicoccales archaeon]|jgi:hypothetical protein
MKKRIGLEKELDRLPEQLRALLEMELESGNEIAEIGHSFPAPPAGLFVMLARPVTTRPHESGGGIEFYDRDTLYHSGEFNDAKRFFFILEPPHPPPTEPDMDTIREAHGADRKVESTKGQENVAPAPDTPLNRFVRSMIIDYEKWHDGIGYDLEALGQASPNERLAIEKLLISSKGRDWRDIEVLAEMDTPRSRKALREAFANGDLEVRMAVISYAPDIIPYNEKVDAIVHSLRVGNLYGGLSHTIDLVEEFHPPEVVEELLRGAREREGEVAVLLAGMLLFVHGKADEPFDWSQRPYLLRFNTEDTQERHEVFLELCQKIGVRAEDHAIDPK